MHATHAGQTKTSGEQLLRRAGSRPAAATATAKEHRAPIVSSVSRYGESSALRSASAAGRRQIVMDVQRLIGNASVNRLMRAETKHDDEDEEVAVGTEEAQEESIAQQEPEAVAEEESSSGETVEGVAEEEGGESVEGVSGEETSEAAPEGEEIDDPSAVAETQTSGTIEPIEGEDEAHGHGCDLIHEDSIAAAPKPGHQLPLKTTFTIVSGSQQAVVTGESHPDSVDSTLTMASSTTKGGVTVGATAFGGEVVKFSFDNINYTTNSGTVNLSATIHVDCKWDVAARGRTNVSGAGDAAVTRATWEKIVTDLTPSASGRPKREKYWAQDLTEKHEKFHATDDIGRATLFMPAAKTLADSKTVSTAAALDVQLRAVMSSVRDAIKADSWSYYHSVGIGGEGRAYADGKSSYQERADAVKAKAVSEGWST